MSRLLKITDNGNGILVQGTDNILYPDNATLTFPYNSIILVTDESDIATFRSASNNDVLFSGLIGNIEIGSTTVTKANIIEKFDEIANQESGGGGEPFDPTDYYTKSQTNALLDEKADNSDIPTDVSELNNDAGYITQSEVIINESFPVDWLSAQSMTDLIQAINDDSDAMVGKVYMDTISLSDLPAGMRQAEVKAEIMSELGDEKVILFTITSSDTSPYHWEYTSAYGATGIWREWLVSSDIANFFDGAEYDSQTKRINFKHGNTIKAYIDATAFIKDGMVDNVEISNGNLVITFNTDAGKQPISIPLTDIFNPANYYDKTTADNTFATQVVVNQEIAARIQGDADINTALGTKADKSDTYTKTEVDTALALKQDASTAFSGDYADLTNKPDLSVYAESADLATVATSGSYNDLSDKPTIPESVTVDAALSDTSENPVQNKVVKGALDAKQDTISDLETIRSGAALGATAYQKPNDGIPASDIADGVIPTVPTNVSAFTNDAGYLTEHQSLDDYYTKSEVDTELADKQDKLTAGSNITIENNVISSTGGGGTQVQSDWNQSDSSAVDYIKNKPTIPDTSDFVSKSEYNPKEVAIAEALTELNENKADKTELPDVSTFATKTELNAKQDALVSGTNIKTINNESILGGGNIEIQGGGGGMDEDTELLISSALVDLNDRKIDATEVKENYQKKGDYATNAKVDTKANISDVPTNTDYEEAQKITSWSLNDLNKKIVELEARVAQLES